MVYRGPWAGAEQEVDISWAVRSGERQLLLTAVRWTIKLIVSNMSTFQLDYGNTDGVSLILVE